MNVSSFSTQISHQQHLMRRSPVRTYRGAGPSWSWLRSRIRFAGRVHEVRSRPPVVRLNRG